VQSAVREDMPAKALAALSKVDAWRVLDELYQP
jgi:hypothetical protein